MVDVPGMLFIMYKMKQGPSSEIGEMSVRTGFGSVLGPPGGLFAIAALSKEIVDGAV
jgi:hypothetical protein